MNALLVEHVLNYAGTDLLCYRAEGDGVLAAKQEKLWNPWLEWLGKTQGATLHSTSGIMPVAQDEEAISHLRNKVASLSAERLEKLNDLTVLLGSLVLGLAVLEGALAPVDAFALSTLDETHQAERWGDDEEAAARLAAKREEFLARAS